MIKQLLPIAFFTVLLAGCQAPQSQTEGPRVEGRAMSSEASPRPSSPAPLSLLSARGREIVDPTGQAVRLRGCNIGCWLLIEPWMLQIQGREGSDSEKEIWDTVEQRFGKEAKLELIKLYREEFFNEEDVRRIADLGLNCMRLPFWWRAVADPEYGGTMDYLDRCVAWGKKYGVYTIIDFHGAPGSQNSQAAIIGEPAHGEFWSADEYKRQTIEIWKEIAARYKDEPAVAGYDLLNEAMDAPYDAMIEFYDQCYQAIREIDPHHLIIMQDAFLGFHRFPMPADRGWSNVVYSFHYYPQNPEEGVIATPSVFPRFQRAALHYNVPVYVGEFNTVLLDRGGADGMLRYNEVFDYYGWAWTFWAYKKIENNRDANWGVYGRTDSNERLDVAKASFAELSDSIRRLNTKYFEIDNLLVTALKEPARWHAPEPASDGKIQLRIRDALLIPGPKGTMRTEWGLVEPNAGYWQYGDTVAWRFSVPEDGVYQLSLEYSSQVEECPVQFWVDSVHAGNVKQQGTGGWDRYAMRPVTFLSLKAGTHVIELNLGERGQSFNLRGGELARAEGTPLAFDETQIWLRPANVNPFAANSPIRIEWLSEPPHFGFWTSGEKATWTVDLAQGGTFQSSVMYATPTKGTRLKLLVDGQPATEKELTETGDWSKFASAELGRVELAPGRHVLELIWDTPASFGAGNLREVKMQRLAK